MDTPSPPRWAEVEQLLDQALDLPPEERAAFLDRSCADAPALRAEVDRLLHAAEEARSFLAEPAPAYAAPLVARMTQSRDPAPEARPDE